MRTKLIAALAVAAPLAIGATPAAAECGRLTIADMNWNSATLMAHVDRFILEHGYGCEAELVPGDTMPTGTSMIEKGEPDLAPEMWTSNFAQAVEKGVEEGRLIVAGNSLSDGGEEGFWVPEYLVEAHPEMATIEGIKANAAMFPHPEDPDKNGFMGCPAGWGCQISSTNLFNAMNLEAAGFELVDPGSGASLAGSIAKAYEREEPWVGYYWAPTAVLGKYPMVKVDFGSGTDPEHYYGCIAKPDCADPKPTMYPPSPVKTLVVADLAERAPEVMGYLESRAFTNDEMNGLLAWMEDNQADGEIAAIHFLADRPDLWRAWVPEAVAAKVQAAVDDF
ncbi:ABC transporter substrate-binding protein [Roseospirillum parvum]|uniref:Glycine betaine/proline transport system substrate-binding protein n=1 Tax=Roseospirillum parvum TaxID=83401 RepID=A0A1G8BLQ6_9PROT|nr:ABC transporter substrate-binding protein [Roseospirillum parvum]SDH34155.1 glycine betaine/proline transport system substrate-binding protein [Roseospirillum parvum]